MSSNTSRFLIEGAVFTVIAGTGMLISFLNIGTVVPGFAIGAILGSGAAWVTSATLRSRATGHSRQDL